MLGALGHAGDVLMQRMKAVETSLQDGHWLMAQELELVPHREGLATEEERAEAVKGQLREHKLKQADPSSKREGDHRGGNP